MTAVLAAATSGGGIHFGWETALAVIGIVSFCLTAAGIVGMGFRVGSNTQAMVNYRETAQSWEAKANALEEQYAECTQKMAEKDAQIAELKAKVSMLERLVLGESTAVRLEKRINEVYAQGSKILDRMQP